MQGIFSTSKPGHEVMDMGYSSPCWIWTGSKDPKGYGNYYITRKKCVKAHRFYYARYKEPIPDGFEIDHLCNVKSCVNPEHLIALTRLAHNRKHHFKNSLRSKVMRKVNANGGS